MRSSACRSARSRAAIASYRSISCCSAGTPSCVDDGSEDCAADIRAVDGAADAGAATDGSDAPWAIPSGDASRVSSGRVRLSAGADTGAPAMDSWCCTAAGVAPGVSGTVACARTPVAGTANAAEGAGATVTGVMVTAGAATEGAVPPCTVLPPRESAVAGGSSSWLSHSATAMMATKTSSPLTTSNRKSHTFFMLYPCLPKAHPPAAITFIHGARCISLASDTRFHGKDMGSPA